MTSSVVTHPAENVWIGLHADVLIELANGGEA